MLLYYFDIEIYHPNYRAQSHFETLKTCTIISAHYQKIHRKTIKPLGKPTFLKLWDGLTEKELITEALQTLLKKSVELIGINIIGFDLLAISIRAEKLHIVNKMNNIYSELREKATQLHYTLKNTVSPHPWIRKIEKKHMKSCNQLIGEWWKTKQYRMIEKYEKYETIDFFKILKENPHVITGRI